MPHLVLIVDDSETCAETLQIALESIPGAETRVTRNTVSALAALRDVDLLFSAVVTDLHMPQSDGFDLIRHLRSHPRYANLPVILISGDSDPAPPGPRSRRRSQRFFLETLLPLGRTP